MCGFTGFIATPKDQRPALPLLGTMAACLAHRGPDDQGVWFDPRHAIGLASRRLAIVDLSAEGHQPMQSTSKRYCIAYNGEVYNFLSLQKELIALGYAFHSHCDTEVVLASIEHWGLKQALEKFIGMFAFALWDQQEKKLHLVRDRLGVKPLYYGLINGAFAFASEIRPLEYFAQEKLAINPAAIPLFLQYNFIPAPVSIYQNIHKLLPGHIASYDLDSQSISLDVYWSAQKIALSGINSSLTEETEKEILDRFDALLQDAVKIRMISDVPLGAFLSGGIDSSTIASLMQANQMTAIKTFSIGFPENQFNEAIYAKEIAQHLNTDHTELYITAQDAMQTLSLMPEIYDEPFADSSQIPTFLISKLAKQSITVALSGDGGDELLMGYNRYFLAPKIWRYLQHVPINLRKKLAMILLQSNRLNDRWSKLFNILPAKNPEDLYLHLLGNGNNTHALLKNHAASPVNLPFEATWQTDTTLSFTEKMMLSDLITYLPDDILTKVDRASMAVSLEVRSPLLDHRLTEFSWKMPLKYKYRQGKSKWLLRQILKQHVPEHLTERPKMGFSIPLSHWLRTEMRGWAEDLLTPIFNNHSPYFDAASTKKLWWQHLAGNHKPATLWSILMLQGWLNRYNKQSSS